MSRFISKTVEIVFLVLLALILLAFAISFGDMVSSGFIGTVATLALLFLCGLFVIFGRRILGFIRVKVIGPLSSLSTWQMVLIIGIVTLITKLFFIFLLNVDSTLHSDMQMYHSFANQIANSGKITEYVTYAAKHKYTAIYGLILSPFAKLFGQDPKVLTVVLTAAVTIASILLFDIIRKYTGNAVAFCGVLLYNLLPMGLFQTQLLVHETALLFFHILSLWLLLKSFEDKHRIALRVLLIVLAGVSIAIGLSINVAGKVVLIAMCIFSFVKIIGEKITVKKLLRTIGFFLIFAISVTLTTNALGAAINKIIDTDNAPVVSSEKKVPYGWSIYLGLNYETSGVINQEDADTYQKYQGFEDAQEAKEYQINLIKERAQEYIDHPIRIPLHLFNKIKVLWGSIWLPFAYAQGNAVEHFILTGFGGLIYKGLYILNSLFYVFILSMILFSLKCRRKESGNVNYPNLHSKMVIIGVTLALICFETTPKYISHLQILVYTIWMFQLKDFCNRSDALNQKLLGKFVKKSR